MSDRTFLPDVNVTIEDASGRTVEYRDCGYSYDGTSIEILMNGGCELWPLTALRRVLVDYTGTDTDAE